ncbi:MAG: ATP-dependent Clp protease proteolytic subunit [Ardenticatenaceae bacterium]|nr:ATP-dependent Clp protease proteolytic subunit [Anaerolineales bacterium]MCB8940936.1 ATP-dependent Clp protease proteolytic subunit [Ardenticatenaceae bacterium]MCB8972275.1 ATP-dependent Clp protease proteolytic subunit [Ardenticatenaceae bacterium]
MIRFEDEYEEPAEEKTKPKKSMMERLLETRTITIFGEINMKLAQEVTEKLMLLAADSDDDIKIFINSPGGHVESGDTIFDMIRFVKPKVKIVGTGWVASAGALIYASADRENRYSLPNTRFLLHQPMGGVRGQAQDIKIEAEEIIKMRERLNRIFSEQTGQPLAKVTKDTERNFWMTAKEAIEYGLVGQIINSADEV